MTMKPGVYVCIIGCLIHLQSAETTLETVWLTDATEKRPLSNIDLPNELAFHLTRRSATLKLNLRRNHDINPNPNVSFARKLQNGTFVLVKSRNIAKQNLAYYQDIENGAFLTVRCVKKSNEQCDRVIVSINGDSDVKKPAEAVRSYEMTKSPKAYVFLIDGAESRKHFSRVGNVDKQNNLPFLDISTRTIRENPTTLYRSPLEGFVTISTPDKEDRLKYLGDHDIRVFNTNIPDSGNYTIIIIRDGDPGTYILRKFAINGNIRIGNRDYELQPAETNVASRNLYDEPGALGRKYVLQDQTHNQREYSVNNKVIVTDKSRQLPKIYYVKVAVLIDQGLWDFYHSTIRFVNLLARNRLTIEKIEGWYSHVMNGVNMVYKGIEDTSIRIIVILSEFIIFKIIKVEIFVSPTNYDMTFTLKWQIPEKHEFQLHESRVVNFFGVYLVDGPSYLNDLITWDKETDVKKKKLFSHGILFTRYKMFLNELSEKELSGLSFVGEVCNAGKRMSAVERRGYVWMVHAAAHELGHNLGACHDGEEDALNCASEDAFIMSKVIVDNHPDKPYNKNPWHFSNCSINSFKRTLLNKTCLNDHVSHHKDYYKYVTKQAGEMFTVNEQCELIAGRRSVLCKTARHNICLLMRCTDPRTEYCIEKYHGAARGTECGKDMWCIDGLCVPKLQSRLVGNSA